jgi:hypothetical protein
MPSGGIPPEGILGFKLDKLSIDGRLSQKVRLKANRLLDSSSS